MGRLTNWNKEKCLLINEEERLLTAKGFIDKDEMYKIMRHLAEKLADYEDLEEQGLLLKLPCKVGDTVYTLNTLPSQKMVIGETTADAFMCALGMLEGRFGKTIFLTCAEAEEALRKINGTEG